MNFHDNVTLYMQTMMNIINIVSYSSGNLTSCSLHNGTGARTALSVALIEQIIHAG